MEITSTSTQHHEDSHSHAFQLLSLLLQYPEGLELDEIREVTNQLANVQVKQLVNQFVDYLTSNSEDNLTSYYVNTFDFNSTTALYLTYSNLGEERERGQILVQLKELYDAVGLQLVSDELPDYLPLVLEFYAVAPREVSRQLIEDFRLVMEKLREELSKIDSPYAWLVEAAQIQIKQYIQ
ncbi:nitrate reductase molybdenum cofactor assembly chaperone [Brevibacillus ginsengisoli]|uniref:nitrate reductase molybdenum cofactor assembly chaperone n=1 Tax=Brevibacillus ginsengisoli TaxID=363854 RepID=UPI003CEC2313